MRKWAERAGLVLGAMLWLAGCALAGFARVATDSGVYKKLQRELDVYAYTGIDKTELDAVMDDVAAYLKGEKEALDGEASVFGVRGPVFNERERMHMEDVRALFRLERRVCAAALAGGVALLALGLWGRRKRARGLAICFLAGACLLALAALWLARQDFNALFLRFHHLLFTNDLWLLNPATDAMIRMYPQAFFEKMAELSLWGMLVTMLAGVAAALLGALAADRLTGGRTVCGTRK